MLDMRRPPRVTQSDAIFSVILVSNPYNLPDEESLLQSSGTSNNSFLRIWIVVKIHHNFSDTFSLLVNYDSIRFYQKESVNESLNMNIMIF